LSRALSDARKYPAIDRLDSKSSYPSLLSNEEVSALKALLREGKMIASNILLMGEKGITDETYIQFQKAELVDAVFLQQNSFHEVDGVTKPERLRMMFDLVWKIIASPVAIKGKEAIRSHFNFHRQAFIDWNTMRPDEAGFNKQKNQILTLIKQGTHAQENV
jgi:V/A-type H+-transporting ATPase subunit A